MTFFAQKQKVTENWLQTKSFFFLYKWREYSREPLCFPCAHYRLQHLSRNTWVSFQGKSLRRYTLKFKHNLLFHCFMINTPHTKEHIFYYILSNFEGTFCQKKGNFCHSYGETDLVYYRATLECKHCHISYISNRFHFPINAPSTLPSHHVILSPSLSNTPPPEIKLHLSHTPASGAHGLSVLLSDNPTSL